MEYITIQYLRGLGAFSVLLYHAIVVASDIKKAPFFIEMLAGGVDIFFVISGFIIWISSKHTNLNPFKWWEKRLIRIVPIYWVALTLTIVINWFEGKPNFNSEEITKSFLFIPTSNSQTGFFQPILGPGWTLNYEFLFYFTMALLLFIKRPYLRLTLLIVGFSILVGLRHFADTTSAFQNSMTSPLFFEFIMGIFIAIISQFQWLNRYKPILGTLAIVAAVLFAIFASPIVYTSGPRIIYFGLPAGLLVFGLVCFESIIRKHIITPLKVLGDSSYSLYLSHVLTLDIPLAITKSIGIVWLPISIMVALIFCVFVGILCHKLIEKPLLTWMSAKLV